MNREFPGHGLSVKDIENFVAECPIGQKARVGHNAALKPLVRVLKPQSARSIISIDKLTITPVDSNGNQYLYVIINLFVKHVGLYPSKDGTAVSCAQAIFQHMTTFGICDIFASDPGSEITSEIVEMLIGWLGMKHRISLVDRHESCGVEGVNKLILGLARCIVFDERIKHRWSDPQILYWIMYVLNGTEHGEAGIIPFEGMCSVNKMQFIFNYLRNCGRTASSRTTSRTWPNACVWSG